MKRRKRQGRTPESNELDRALRDLAAVAREYIVIGGVEFRRDEFFATYGAPMPASGTAPAVRK